MYYFGRFHHQEAPIRMHWLSLGRSAGYLMRFGDGGKIGEITHRSAVRREVIKIGRGVLALAINKYTKRPDTIHTVGVCGCVGACVQAEVQAGRKRTTDCRKQYSPAMTAAYVAGGGSARRRRRNLDLARRIHCSRGKRGIWCALRPTG